MYLLLRNGCKSVNVYIVALVFGIGCGLIGLFMGCKFSNNKVDDIVSENYDLQKENEWLRTEMIKLKSNNIEYIK